MVTGVSPLDVWSIVHALSGAGLAYAGIRTRWSVAILVGFEVVEAGLRLIPQGEGFLFEYESFSNVVADVFIGLVGFLAAEVALRRYAIKRLLHHWREYWAERP